VLTRVAPDLDVQAVQRILSNLGGDGHPLAPAERGDEKQATMLTPVEKMLHLRAVDLFEGLTTHQLSELALVVCEVMFGDGQAIVAEGEFDDRMYFIVSGTVRIVRGEQVVAELGARDFFGEMAVFDGETRSATATAVGDVMLLRLTRNDLFDVMEDQPAIGIGICQILVRRVRNMLKELSEQR
jgi:CRP-like cAMP-binding protein